MHFSLFHLNFLYVAVSWVLLRWHDLFTLLGFSDTSGWGWTLSIIFLVVTARLLLVRLFIRQVHYTRNMQKMQPKIQKLKEKYKDDRPELNRQMMALQQEEGFNPLSGCLPMLLQIPVFLGLFHVLRHLSNSAKPGVLGAQSICQAVGISGNHVSQSARNLLSLYTFSGGPHGETCHAAQAKVLGSPLAASFRDSNSIIRGLGGDPSSTRIVLVILLVISAAATMATQIMVKRNATTVPEGSAATIQKVMLYIIPIGVLASGLIFNFPLGVLLYWFTSNLWTLGQQAYIIRFHPPTEEPLVVVGERGKALAPKPGQRPVRQQRATQGTSSGPASTVNLGKSLPADDVLPAGTQQGKGSGQQPQRPSRPAGKRPPAKRPTKAKKRR